MVDWTSRVSRLFSVLDSLNPDASTQAPPWCVGGAAVQTAGRAAPESDDDDEEDNAAHDECAQILRECLSDDDEQLGELPSAAACQAFKAEAEEDDFDRFAAESLSKLGCQVSLKPALKTTVANRNVYDRLCGSQSAPDSPVSGAEHGGELLQAVPGRQLGSVKRVRFREDDPETLAHASSPPKKLASPSCLSPRSRRRVSEGGGVCSPWDHSSSVPDLLGGALLAPPAPSAPQSTAAGAGTTISDASIAQVSRSYVPDHVRNPSKYTCYALDEEVVVGGGIQGDLASNRPSFRDDAVATAGAEAGAVIDSHDVDIEDATHEHPRFVPRDRVKDQIAEGSMVAGDQSAVTKPLKISAPSGPLSIHLDEQCSSPAGGGSGESPARQDGVGRDGTLPPEENSIGAITFRARAPRPKFRLRGASSPSRLDFASVHALSVQPVSAVVQSLPPNTTQDDDMDVA